MGEHAGNRGWLRGRAGVWRSVLVVALLMLVGVRFERTAVAVGVSVTLVCLVALFHRPHD